MNLLLAEGSSGHFVSLLQQLEFGDMCRSLKYANEQDIAIIARRHYRSENGANPERIGDVETGVAEPRPVVHAWAVKGFESWTEGVHRLSFILFDSKG